MNLKDLPPVSDLIIKTNVVVDMVRALLPIMNRRQFRYMEPVHGAERSIRLLLTKSTPTSVSWNLDALQTVKEISRLTDEARYAPWYMPHPPLAKGWEIRQLEIEGAPVILIWAAWIYMI